MSADTSAIGQAILSVADELGLSRKDAEDTADAEGTVRLQVRELSGPDPGGALVGEVNDLRITLLIIPASSAAKAEQHGGDWQRSLYQYAPCEAMYLRDDAHQDFADLKVLVAVTGQAEDSVALRCAGELAKKSNGNITAIYVGPDVDEVSTVVGHRILKRIVKGALGRDAADVQQEVVLADSLVAGLCQYELADFDLILFGSRWRPQVSLFGIASGLSPAARWACSVPT